MLQQSIHYLPQNLKKEKKKRSIHVLLHASKFSQEDVSIIKPLEKNEQKI